MDLFLLGASPHTYPHRGVEAPVYNKIYIRNFGVGWKVRGGGGRQPVALLGGTLNFFFVISVQLFFGDILTHFLEIGPLGQNTKVLLKIIRGNFQIQFVLERLANKSAGL